MECPFCGEEIKTSEPIVLEYEYDSCRDGIDVAVLVMKEFCSDECKNEYLTSQRV